MKLKNNIFKISLLLLVSNLSNIYASENPEMLACYAGQRARGGRNGVSLMVTGDEILNGTSSCNSLYRNNIRQRAACIFGFNSNLAAPKSPAKQGYTYGNGCDISGMFNPPAPGYWGGYSCSGCADNRFCIDGVGVCDFGNSIGWALNDDGSNTLNFYRNDGYNWPNYLLYFIWGKTFGANIWGNGQRNMLRVIELSYRRQWPNSAGFSNSGVLSRANSPYASEADGIKCVSNNGAYTNDNGCR